MDLAAALTEKEQSKALCNGVATDWWFPDIFDDDGNEWPDDGQIYEAFGDTSHYYERGRAVCEQCPIRERCLEVAMSNRERYGMWGGLTPLERRRIERRERRAKRQARLLEEEQNA